jgi:integrase/recombinase XerD
MRITDAVTAYIIYLKVCGRSLCTVKNARSSLRSFTAFIKEAEVTEIEDIAAGLLEEYQQELAFRLTKKGNLLSLRTQGQLLLTLKSFTRFLKEKDHLLSDPAGKIKLPKKPQRLPKVILTTSDVKKLIYSPDTRTNKGYRNRIILEILYDTAIRRAELASIKLSDLDLDAGYIRIRGKGDKDRVVPLSKRVCELIQNYIMGIRPYFIKDKDNDYLILNRWGKKMDPNAVWAVVKSCSHAANIKKNISTHTLRHTCATHMLKNGAPVRHIQELLGHESLESTQIYTHVTINDLKEIHAKYHPSETMGKE